MAQVLVRDLDDDTVAILKQRAKQHHRSLQSEIRTILVDAASFAPPAETAARLRAMHKEMFGNKVFPDSTPLIREDRER
jgi:plasmid stability protein